MHKRTEEINWKRKHKNVGVLQERKLFQKNSTCFAFTFRNQTNITVTTTFFPPSIQLNLLSKEKEKQLINLLPLSIANCFATPHSHR